MGNKMKLTGTTYSSVADMLRDAIDDECANEFEQRAAKSRLVNQLVRLRVVNDLTQKDLAAKLGRSQAWVSKIEHSFDESLSLGDLVRYAKALGFGTRVELSPKDFGKAGLVVEILNTDESGSEPKIRKRVYRSRKPKISV